MLLKFFIDFETVPAAAAVYHFVFQVCFASNLLEPIFLAADFEARAHPQR